MKIYTKTGDKGETSLFRGGRVAKDAARLAAYGTLDELNSGLGLATAYLAAHPDLHDAILEIRRVQRDLFALGGQLATVGAAPTWAVTAADILFMEQAIDRMDADLTPLTAFILPGGHPAGAALHVARTVARRAEREILGAGRQAEADGQPLDELVVPYINRLSDYLFVLARFVNMRLGTPEPPLVM